MEELAGNSFDISTAPGNKPQKKPAEIFNK
jgi:hypothetical protein